jgi:predicted O-linked N-acetylglucosamine transferase (SPINDLY family)
LSHGKPQDSDPISDQLNRAVWLYQVGDLNAAERLCKTILRKKPASPVALHLLAAMAIRHAQFDEALALLDRALRFKADYFEALVERGNVLQLLNRHDAALASYESASRLRPDDVEAIYNRALALVGLGRHAEALQSFDRVLTIEPRHVRALNNRGGALHVLNRLEEALSSYDQALALEPRFAEALANRGVVLTALNRHSEALASLDKALLITPNDADALYYRGFVLGELNRCEDAAASYERALKARPRDAKTEFALCMSSLPTLYMGAAEIAQRRDVYAARLQSLSAEVARGRARDFAGGVGPKQPFYLAYQGENDRALQSIYGAMVCKIMADRYPAAALAGMPPPGEAVRVGIVSGFFRNHSNWKIPIRGWLSELDRRRFRLFGYYTDGRADAQTEEAARFCERFVRGPLPVARWRDAILADAPHVLIYPEVGMDNIAVQLAAQRLAPVQCNSWGHPDTSGFPTLDYFLSSDLMEPADGQDHYTERLVRLPNLSFHYEPPATPHETIERAALGLRPTATAFWCGQSLFKYLPQFDEVFPRIAREHADCQFVFVGHHAAPDITRLFQQRLERAFDAFGLKATDHCVFLPRLDPQKFAAAIGCCDIILDSIGWSGCNSTFESLHHHLPIVTMAGRLMRGRHTMAILRMMNVTETITETLDHYVATAVRLATDADWRRQVSARMAAGRDAVYRDRACIEALEAFLSRVTQRQPV